MSSFELSFESRVCRACHTTLISGKWRDRCLHCGHPYEPSVLAPVRRREHSPYHCPLCEEPPRSCSCLRASVRRRIALAIGA